MAKLHFSRSSVKQWITFKDNFDRQIEMEIMHSERLRAVFLAGVFCAISLIVTTFLLVSPRLLSETFGDKVNLWIFVLVVLLYAIYEFGFFLIVGIFKKRGNKFPWGPKFANAFLEVSLPSLLIIFLLSIITPELAFSMPPIFIYFLFIILSAIRLEPRLSFFTGFVAAVEFLGISLWTMLQNPAHTTTDPQQILTLPVVMLSKTFIILIAGLITAFVSWQIRNRMIAMFQSREEKNLISSIFGQHVSPAVMERLLHQKTGSESENRSVCILFLDIRNFTAFSQNRNPEEVVEFLNKLFSFMIDIVNTHHGIINKFLGDGFMAVFGAPLDDPHACANAVNAALDISDRLKIEVSNGQIIPTAIGMGLHTGHAVTGSVGSTLRKEYTIIGDVVNLASRLEQLNKEYGSEILISDEVRLALNIINDSRLTTILNQSTNLGYLKVKGRESEVNVYRLR